MLRFTLAGLATVLGFFVADPSAAGGQTAREPSFTLRVVVVDSDNRPVGGVEVAILRGMQEVLGHATTTNAGTVSLVLPHQPGEYQATARKIGYQRADRFFPAPSGDTAALVLLMSHAVQTIAAVTITAQQDLKRKSYHVDADDIANSSRPIFNAMDVLTKLRPDMLAGRSGMCPIVEVWVNGRRILMAPTNDMALARRGLPPPAPAPGKSQATARRPLPKAAIWSAGENVLSVLSSIKPEHIAEINYADCFDTTVDRIGAQQAAFVVLKPGVSYDPGIGSFVDETRAALPSQLPEGGARAGTVADNALAYRRRLLGVYDWTTGDPVQGADVIDVATGMFVTTSETGTVTLLFLPEGLASLRIRRAGFSDLTLDVSISPHDTLPITLLMTRPR